MRSKFHKLFWIWQLDKEESWINDMAAHGYALVHAGRFCNYEFDEVEPGKYIYKSLFLKGSGDSTKNREYYRFLDEMGIETVSTFWYPGNCVVYLRALRDDYPNGIELYSDIDSRINYENTLRWYLLGIGIYAALTAVYNMVVAFLPHNSFTPVNIICSVVMAVLAVYLFINFAKKSNKIRELRKEREIHE